MNGCPPVYIAPGNHDPAPSDNAAECATAAGGAGSRGRTRACSTHRMVQRPVPRLPGVRVWDDVSPSGVESTDRPLASHLLAPITAPTRWASKSRSSTARAKDSAPPAEDDGAVLDAEVAASPFVRPRGRPLPRSRIEQPLTEGVKSAGAGSRTRALRSRSTTPKRVARRGRSAHRVRTPPAVRRSRTGRTRPPPRLRGHDRRRRRRERRPDRPPHPQGARRRRRGRNGLASVAHRPSPGGMGPVRAPTCAPRLPPAVGRERAAPDYEAVVAVPRRRRKMTGRALRARTARADGRRHRPAVRRTRARAFLPRAQPSRLQSEVSPAWKRWQDRSCSKLDVKASARCAANGRSPEQGEPRRGRQRARQVLAAFAAIVAALYGLEDDRRTHCDPDAARPLASVAGRRVPRRARSRSDGPPHRARLRAARSPCSTAQAARSRRVRHGRREDGRSARSCWASTPGFEKCAFVRQGDMDNVVPGDEKAPRPRLRAARERRHAHRRHERVRGARVLEDALRIQRAGTRSSRARWTTRSTARGEAPVAEGELARSRSPGVAQQVPLEQPGTRRAGRRAEQRWCRPDERQSAIAACPPRASRRTTTRARGNLKRGRGGRT